MAATKLNPSAPPFPRPCHLGPAPPPTMLPYHPAACPPPFGAIYFCAGQFHAMPSPHHLHPFIQFPVLCKATGHAPQARFLRKGGKKAPPRFLRKGFVAPKQTKALSPAPPAEHEHDLPEDVGKPAPHGLPPHKLMIPGGGAKKKPASEAAAPAQKKPASGAAAPGEEKPAVGRLRRGRNPRRKTKPNNVRDGAVVGPRACTTWVPSTTAFTTHRKEPLPDKPPAYLGFCTTLMVRNIPNRLRCDEMIALLDQHCARANRLAGAVVAAYDVVYLPIDFRRQGNYGYAFVNFTTAEAASGLYYWLHGCGWKVCGSTKIIEIAPANIQGKAELVRHFDRHRFECENVDYLPAVFTPPRDGGAQATATTTTRVGKLAPGATWQPRFLKTARKAYAAVLRPKVQG